MKAKEMFTKTGKWFDKNSSVILLVLGIGGLLTTTVVAASATPKAQKKMLEHKEKINDVKERLKEAKEPEEIKGLKKEKALLYLDAGKDLGLLYGPAAVLACSSCMCLIKSHNIEHRRLTAMTTAYQISETARREYKDKVVEALGQKKEKDIRDAIAKDKVEQNPPDKQSDVYNSTQDTLCYDTMSGRYFRSSGDHLKKIENMLNKRLRIEHYISLNELYDELGMDHIKLGDDIGWNIERDEIEFNLSGMLNEDDIPILVLDYFIAPRYDYRYLH